MIVLDSHVLIWAASEPDQLSTAALHAMTTDAIGVSPITCWEIGMLARKRLITIEQPLVRWFETALTDLRSQLLPLTVQVAARGAALPYPEVTDPVDRLLIATALEHDAAIVTSDERIRRSGLVETIW